MLGQYPNKIRIEYLAPKETPRAAPHAGCCGGWELETPGYSIVLYHDFFEVTCDVDGPFSLPIRFFSSDQ